MPLTIADHDGEQGTITLVVQEVGKTTLHMGTMQAGDSLASLTGPLGLPSEIECYGTVICVGGGFACVDGPEFDGHQVDWDLLLARQRIYVDQEKQATARWEREERGRRRGREGQARPCRRAECGR